MSPPRLMRMQMPKYKADKFTHRLLDESSDEVKNELKQLIPKGAWLKKRLDEHVTLVDLGRDPNAIWSIFLNYGLLTFEPVEGAGYDIYKVSIPNQSIRLFLLEKIINWENKTKKVRLTAHIAIPSVAESKPAEPVTQLLTVAPSVAAPDSEVKAEAQTKIVDLKSSEPASEPVAQHSTVVPNIADSVPGIADLESSETSSLRRNLGLFAVAAIGIGSVVVAAHMKPKL